MAKSKSLIIVQEYLPAYRVGFFSSLIDVLAQSGIECRVAAGTPQGEQSIRDDAVTKDWVVPIRQRRIRVGGRTLRLGGAGKSWAGSDGVIVSHLGSSVDTYRAILGARRSPLRVGLWGHLDSYVFGSHPLDRALERWQLRHADHVFAYTPSGTAYAASLGIPSERLTTVMNSVDTRATAQAKSSLSQAEVAEFMSRYGLKRGRVLGFIGGLDESKRIKFLAAALDRLWATDPDVRLVVGGAGSQAGLLNASVARGQTIRLGRVGPKGLALIGGAASALLMPGRIGLVAVDALLLGVPVLTTNWRYHSAEAEYLKEGESRFTSSNDVESFVKLIHAHLTVVATGTAISSPRSWPHPTIESMVSNFTKGVHQMFKLPGRSFGSSR